MRTHVESNGHGPRAPGLRHHQPDDQQPQGSGAAPHAMPETTSSAQQRSAALSRLKARSPRSIMATTLTRRLLLPTSTRPTRPSNPGPQPVLSHRRATLLHAPPTQLGTTPNTNQHPKPQSGRQKGAFLQRSLQGGRLPRSWPPTTMSVLKVPLLCRGVPTQLPSGILMAKIVTRSRRGPLHLPPLGRWGRLSRC